jgi:hypothetical protein
MKTILAVVVLVVAVWGCKKKGPTPEERCESDCPKYGAVFANVSCPGLYCDWQCWCRRSAALPEQSEQVDCSSCEVYDTDHGEVCKTKVRSSVGSGSEPLRIW